MTGNGQPWLAVPLALGVAVSLSGPSTGVSMPAYSTELTDSGVPGQLDMNPTYVVPDLSWDLHQKIISMEKVAQDLLRNGKNLDPAISNLVDERFWDLL